MQSGNQLLVTSLIIICLGIVLVAGYKACSERKPSDQTVLVDRQLANDENKEIIDEDNFHPAERNLSDIINDKPADSVKPKPKISTKPSIPKDPQPQNIPTNHSEEVTQPPVVAEPKKPTKNVIILGDDPELTNSGKVANYYVVAGTFSKLPNARKQMETLVIRGYQYAEIVRFDNSAYYSVIVNRFNDENNARALVKELRSKGIDSFKHKRRTGRK